MEVLERNLETLVRFEQRGGEAVQRSEGVRLEGGVPGSSTPQHFLTLPNYNSQYQLQSDTSTPQAVIQSPFSVEGGPAAEAMGGEPRFAYLPTAAVSDVAPVGVSLQPSQSTLTHSGGQFYVMMTPPDVLHAGAPRSIAPHPHPNTAKTEGPRTPRDDRRRAQHNEVERRRRDKINNWIITLSKIIPDCNLDTTKTGASKGGILSKACDYIQELRQQNHRLQEGLNEVKRVQMDRELLQQQVEELKSENAFLRARLQQGGVGGLPDEPLL
ncbi:upstream stimulatory factor 2 [Astyanax mexicanus]|uniref:upstream stimulatory factor 2 n=1 Tax=Astyanax mexicanus TaxID=7994 RepID=UPI0020CABA94|nr:upstream stimulatory factor 2 [Astyanax mexicanus]